VNQLSKTLALAAAILTAIGAWTGNPITLSAAVVLFIAAWLTLPRRNRPQVPLDDAYYAQPLRRRVLAGLLGARTRPASKTDWLDEQHTHHDDGL